MSSSRFDRVRVSLTPAGAGVFSLFFPGLLICAVARQRLLLAVSVGAGLVLLANIVMSRVALRRLAVSVRAPSIATVGAPSAVTVELAGDQRPLECAVGLFDTERAWIPALAPVRGEMPVVFGQRGFYESLPIKVQTRIPFGLTSCVRTFKVSLSEPLHVAPATVMTTIPPPPSTGDAANQQGSGESMGLRAYVPGDPQRDVHWPTVARTGTMMVRDRRVETLPTEVAVSMGGDLGDDFELVLGRVRAVADQLLGKGHAVTLTTLDGPQRSPVTGQVRSSQAVAARLARARRPRGLAVVPDVVVGHHLVVSREGTRWQGVN